MRGTQADTDWLGRLPTSWRRTPLKHMTALVNGCAFKPEDWGEDGTPIIRIENLNGSLSFNRTTRAVDRRYEVHRGDLLFGWSGNRGTSFGPFIWDPPAESETGWLLNQHIFRLHGYQADRRWFYWVLRAATSSIEEQTSGIIGMVHVTKEELGNTRLPAVPLSDQRKIARFLDRETARIDALITAKRRMIELLEARWQTAMQLAVSGSLTRGGDFRAAQSPWLRAVPSHWREVKLTLVARLGSGHTPSRQHPEWWQDATIPWITTGEVSQMRSDRIEFITMTREMISDLGMANSSATLHPAGTVVLCRTASAGYSAIMGVPMATSQDFATWTCGPLLRPRFLLLCLRAMRQDLLGRLAMGSTHQTIYMPDIEAIRIPLPPLQEQDQIVDESYSVLGPIDATTGRLHAQSDLLVERREALITAAVTGEIGRAHV